MPGAIQSLDNAVLSFFQSQELPDWLDSLMVAVSRMGDASLFWLGLIIVLLLSPRTRRMGVGLAVALLLAIIAGDLLLKNLIARPRPIVTYPDLKLLIETPAQYSFPSGHAMQSAAVATALWRQARAKAAVFVVLAVLIAFSRVYLSVHYLSDVVAGLLLGIACGAAGAAWGPRLWDEVEKRNGRKKEQDTAIR